MAVSLGIIASSISGHLWEPQGSYDALSTVTLSTSTSSITFAGIPSTYKHLQLRGIYRSTYVNPGLEELKIQLNSDTGSNYAYHSVHGNGSTVGVYGVTSATGIRTPSTFPSDQSTASSYGASIIDILDYANASKYKTVRSLSGADTNGQGYVGLSSGLWINTAPVNSITLTNWASSEVFKQYSTFTLYGVK